MYTKISIFEIFYLKYLWVIQMEYMYFYAI